MSIWEILLIGVALAMDAVAVGMTDGMTEPRMPLPKMCLVAGAFALFQFAMPLLGYYASYAFSSLIAKIAPYLSFALLLLIGGKMIFDSVREMKKKETDRRPLGAGKLLVQAVATSLDALAVGVTLLAVDAAEGLPLHAALCALLIGGVTFLLALPAVAIGKRAGDAFSDKAGIVGGVVLIAIGVKILVEGLL